MMVYLIHFSKSFKGKQHYIGYTENLEQRIHAHRCTCDGAQILKAARQNGVSFKVVRVWENGDRALERKLKNRHNSKQLCLLCQGKEFEELCKE